MQYLTTSILILLVSVSASAQEFSFPLYFEDANGAKDTLIYGYDEDATDGIDSAFGESNIKEQSFDSIFEVRLSDFAMTEHSKYTFDSTTYHTKVQIKEKDCFDDEFPLVSAIIMKEVEYPLEVSWDSTIFFDECLVESLIADWHPGGWFDAVHGEEQGAFFLKDQNSITLNYTTHHYIQGNFQDTVDMIFLALGSEEGGILHSIDHELSEEVNVFPVPATSIINIELPDNQRVDSYSVLNVKGEKQAVNREGDGFIIGNLASGTYFLHLRLGGKYVVKKFIKK